MNESTTGLSGDDKRFLLRLARSVIAAKSRGETFILPSGGWSKFLDSHAGVFVSLHTGGTLRGCVGFVSPDKNLITGVAHSAESAAFSDSRFPPVGSMELKDIEIEISILTQPEPVDSYEKIELGKHGIILEKHGHRALFLPQVPAEYGWDLAATLSHLAQKAGLPAGAWREGASFQVFESIVFSEKSL